MSTNVYPVDSEHRSPDLWEEDCGMFRSRMCAAKALFIPLVFDGILGFIGWVIWKLYR